MRDISVCAYDSNGLASFDMANIAPATGINTLVAKLTKKIFSSTFSNALFEYYGMDLKELPYYGIGESNLSIIKTLLVSKLKNIQTSIQDNLCAIANEKEQLSKINLDDLVYNASTGKVSVKITLYPVAGDSQTFLFPLDS